MGSQQSKKARQSNSSRRSRRSSNNSSLILSADSLDLIYIDDYFDDEKYKKLVAKRLAEKKKKKAGKNGSKKSKSPARSDTAIRSKTLATRSNKATRSAPLFVSKTKPSSKGNLASKPKPAKPTPSKSVRILAPPPATKTVPPSSLSTGNLPSSDQKPDSTDKIPQNASWHAGVSGGNDNAPSPMVETRANPQGRLLHQQQQLSHANSPFIKSEQIFKPRSILTTSKSKPKDVDVSEGAKRKRSYVVIKDPTLQKSNSLADSWSPAAASASTDYERSPRPLAEASFHGENGAPSSSEPGSTKKSPAKKKLIVRGLQNYVNTHKRDSSSVSSAMDSYPTLNGRRRGESGGGGPAIWKREFPSKSKFHPDNYIYDWPEGPNAPMRPFSAMAKCKKHGGRCNDCGLFTCDLCQSCRKCENDCGCPINRGNAVCNNPYSPAGVHEEIFGGDGWTKARKVLCDLTEQDKRHPVGGNASKRKQNMDENFAQNNFYKPQIDVLNPYNVPLNETPPPGVRPPFQCPMYPPPPMYPMPFMPMPMMPPPMMSYYPPPLCPSYDSCCYAPPPPPCPYSTSDCFMPAQNY